MSKLDQLLFDAQLLEAQAEQDRRAAYAAECEAARCAVIAAFGGVWDELAPYADAGNTWTSNGRITTWWTVIQVPGLAPFSVAVQNVNHMGSAAPFLVANTSPESGWTRYTFRELPEFLLARRRAWEEHAAKARAERIAELRCKLDGYDSQRAATILDADAVLAELLALDPDSREEWTGLHAAWQLWRSGKDEEKRAEQAERERQASLAAEYGEAYYAYYTALQRALAVNAGRLDAFQAELDRPFRTWELVYAVVGNGEEGEYIADTRTAHVLAGEPDGMGYWTVAGKNLVERKRFFNLVSLTGPLERRPTDDDVCGQITIGAPGDHYWRHVNFHPLADREQVRTQALDLLEPWPAQPEPPEELERRTAESIRRKVAGDDDYDIPY